MVHRVKCGVFGLGDLAGAFKTPTKVKIQRARVGFGRGNQRASEE